MRSARSSVSGGRVRSGQRRRITSYNVCYTKLLRLSLGRTQKKAGHNEEYDAKGTLILKETIEGEERSYTLARCCNPIPGDEVVAVRQDDDSMVVHRTDCRTAVKIMSSQGDKLVAAKWTQHKVLSYLTRIELSGWDRFGVYNAITNIV